MTAWWQKMSTKYPRLIVGVSIAAIIGLGWYGLGIFGELSHSTDMQAGETESVNVQRIMEEEFGASADRHIILFNRTNDALGDADTAIFQTEVNRLLEPLESKSESIIGYNTTGSYTFISKDKSAAYVAVTMKNGVDAYKELRSFADNTNSSKLQVRISGNDAINSEMNDTVARELMRVELVSLPVLLVLLLIFFRSAIAALMPIGIALYTVLGAIAIARGLSHFVDIDSYAVNVITMLGIGLSIDYALLSVNRYREELPKGVDHAVQKIIATSGHTIFFSGITVMACLLALLVFPIDLMHSIAIGGASAVAVAMLTTYIVLPSALKILGNRINLGQIGHARPIANNRTVWQRIATVATARPWYSLVLGIAVIALAFVPLRHFQAGDMDYKWLSRATEAGQVTATLAEQFPQSSSDATVLVRAPEQATDSEKLQLSCDLTSTIQSVPGVKNVRSGTPVSETLPCTTIKQLLTDNTAPAQLQAAATSHISKNNLVFDVEMSSDDQSAKEKTMLSLRAITAPKAELLVGGPVANLYDSNRIYLVAAPWAIGIIALSMLVLLALALRSFVVPLQTIITNMLGLAISMAVIVGIFQRGWLQSLSGWPQVDGIVLAAPILVAAVAFGLAMDYSVFIYSRMREVYDETGEPITAIRQSIIKTGPIITAAAIALFVVVVGFATSSILFMQIIGVGLAVAVIVDAFFIRLIIVPAIMSLLGKHGWK